MGRYPPPRVGKPVSADDRGSGEVTFLVLGLGIWLDLNVLAPTRLAGRFILLLLLPLDTRVVSERPVERDVVAITVGGAVRFEGKGTCVARFARRDWLELMREPETILDEERSVSLDNLSDKRRELVVVVL